MQFVGETFLFALTRSLLDNAFQMNLTTRESTMETKHSTDDTFFGHIYVDFIHSFSAMPRCSANTTKLDNKTLNNEWNKRKVILTFLSSKLYIHIFLLILSHITWSLKNLRKFQTKNC